MIIYNRELNDFCNFLLSLELVAKESRLRTRFIKFVSDRLKEIEDERQQLLNKYGNKDENGNIKIIDNKYYDILDVNSFNKEFNELMNEQYIIDETNERKDMLLNLRNIILNCDKTFSGNEAFVYDRYCEIVEQIDYSEV